MNHDAHSIIQNELDSGETLVWAGIPKQGVVFRRSDAFMIPFSLLWGGFAIFWEIGVIVSGSTSEEFDPVHIIFSLFGIPFVIVGLYLIFGRFIYDSKVRSKTFYGLTDQRAIIVSGLFGKRIKSLNLKTMSDISLSEKTDGRGTITFGQGNETMSMLVGRGSDVPEFELIENAKQVYNQLRAQLEN